MLHVYAYLYLVYDYIKKTSTASKGDWRYPHMPILCPLAARRFVPFRASEGAKFLKMGDSLLRTPLNHRAKFDAASFILAGEIRNRTNKKYTNKQ